MTPKKYRPQPDSVPDKAMTMMRELGRGVKASEISVGTGYRASNIGNVMQSCVNHGLVKKMGSGRNGVYWCLPEHAGPGFAPPEDGGRTVRTAQPADDQADGTPQLVIAVWHDGDVVVTGGIEVESPNAGVTVQYSHGQIAQLVRMLAQPTVAL